MSSPAQIEANRANSQHSTGPKTPVGVATAKYNATRHGLTGKQIVIKGEDPAEYDVLHADMVAAYAPASEIEAMFVEDIVQNLWRKQRAKKVEAQILDKYGALECMIEPEAQKTFANITRYLTAIEKGWRKSCSELEKLQKARKQAEKEAQEAANQAAATNNANPQPAAAPQIGFVSQKPADVAVSLPAAEKLAS